MDIWLQIGTWATLVSGGSVLVLVASAVLCGGASRSRAVERNRFSAEAE